MADALQRDGSVDAAEVRLNRLLNLILETAVDVLGYDAATVTSRHDEGLSTIAATDQRFLELDQAQYQAGEGPCLAVLDPSEPVAWSDQDADASWRAFREAADHLGVLSSLSVHVRTDEASEIAASLNLYARSRRTRADQGLKAAEAFAAQLAAAMEGVDAARATARLATGLAEAMRSRAVIEQAKGILIGDKRVSADEAFALLVRMSQNANVKVRDVAQRLVDERSRRG
jgi:GAF domain-containing protein